jgi:hypothetical protein
MTQWFSWKHFFGQSVPVGLAPGHPPTMEDLPDDGESRLLSPIAAPIHG